MSVFRFEREVQRQDGGRCTGRNTWLEVVRSDPMMLLHRPHRTKAVGREELAHRAEEFSRGRWTDLISQAQYHRVFAPRVHPQTDEDDMELRGHAAMAKIQAGQVSRARHVLTGAPLAPRTEETFRQEAPGTSPANSRGSASFQT